MYAAIILALMVVLPAGSAVAEFILTQGGAGWLAVLGKWFVFWAGGVRLLIAGPRQVFRPALTAQLLQITDPAANKLVRELGFGNLAIGTVSILSLPLPGWTLAAATAGAIFYGLAGAQHASTKGRSSSESWAMWSDLGAFVVLALYVGLSLLQR